MACNNNSGGQIFLADEAEMLAFGAKFARLSEGRALVFLQGDLGMGKTTFCRGVLQALGHQGAVKSPTYTLVEPYELGQYSVYHFDLYRLSEAEELEYFGVRDYFNKQSLCLIEWPEKGQGFLPKADIELQIGCQQTGRLIVWQAYTEVGQNIAAGLN